MERERQPCLRRRCAVQPSARVGLFAHTSFVIRPTPSGRCFSFAYSDRVVRLRLQHCPIKRPTAMRLVAANMTLVSPLCVSIFHFTAIVCSQTVYLTYFLGVNAHCMLVFGCDMVCCSNTLLYPTCILGYKSSMVGLFLMMARFVVSILA